MPSVDGKTVEARVVNEGEPPSPDFTVSVDDIKWVGLRPPPAPELIDTPEKALIVEVIRPFLYRGYGTAFVACRVVERHAGYVIVEVPAIAGTSRLSVRPNNVGRPYRPRPTN